jgi:MFS family permease
MAMTVGRLWLGMAVLVSGSLLAWILRYGTAVALPGFQADFQTDAAALGALAAAYFWPYAAIQPFAGLLSHWWGPERALTVWLALAGLGTALFAMAPNYALALLGRALGGAGVGIVLVVAFSLIAQWFDRRRFATVAGLYVATGPLGGLLATHPLAALIEALGWRLAFGAIALWLLLTAAAAHLTIPETRESGARGHFRDSWSGLVRAARLRNVWLCAVYAFVALGILSSMQGLWTVPFLVETYRLDPGAATDVLQTWSLGLLVALPAWGWLVDHVTRSHKRTMLASVALHALPWLMLWLAPASVPAGALFAFFLFIALANGCWMPAYALVQRTSPPALQASALGLLNLAFFLGAACFQQLSGMVLAAGCDYPTLFALFAAALALSALALAATREPHG